jgi:hypothetical protein
VSSNVVVTAAAAAAAAAETSTVVRGWGADRNVSSSVASNRRCTGAAAATRNLPALLLTHRSRKLAHCQTPLVAQARLVGFRTRSLGESRVGSREMESTFGLKKSRSICDGEQRKKYALWGLSRRVSTDTVVY